MSDRTPSTRDAIVSLRSLPEPSLVEAALPAETAASIDPVTRALLLNRYRELRERLERETAGSGPDVMVTAQDPALSRLQSRLAQIAEEGDPLGPGGQEVKFGTGFAGRDWFGWLASLMDWVDRRDAHPFVSVSAPADTVPDRLQVAVVGDWGTGLYGAPPIADDMVKRGPFDLLLHLGDVYYSGTPEEVKERLVQPWPFRAGATSRTLNANHEMYSGGYGYFDTALPRFEQAASYFAFQNRDWLLVGLDTAYVDHDMAAGQVDWLNTVIQAAGRRKVVLFSHQQLFSRLDAQGEKLEPKLRALLEARRITAWYWGHEHQCVLYDRHQHWGLTARCLGNGGIPEPRHKEVKGAPAERSVSYVSWRRLAADPANRPWSPPCLVLDGPNPYIKGREDDFVPHGYMTLDFDGPTLTERVLLPDGTTVLEHQLG
jgi:hypothetical protein